MSVCMVGLIPDRALCEEIAHLKRAAKEIAGNYLYMKDEPHLTLYIGEFHRINRFFRPLEILTERMPKIRFKITEWLLFSDDIITKKQTLACRVEKSANLAILQEKIVSLMSRYRRRIAKRYLGVEGFSHEEKKSLKKYGFPFVGSIWKPHISIGSFEKDHFVSVWKTLRRLCPSGFYEFTSINFYNLNQRTDRLMLQKKFPLKESINDVTKVKRSCV